MSSKITDEVNSLKQQFSQMIDHITRLEQGLHNLNGKIKIHMKEGHILNATSQADNRVYSGADHLDNNSGDTV